MMLIDAGEVLPVVQEFCARRGYSYSGFGRACGLGKSFITELGRGRAVKMRTYNKIRSFIEARDGGVNLPPPPVKEKGPDKRVSFEQEKIEASEVRSATARLETRIKRYFARVAEWNGITIEQAQEALLGKEPAASTARLMMSPGLPTQTLGGVAW